MVDFEHVIEYAYKKLKSSVYFDKTQLILRDKIVEYETRGEDEEGNHIDIAERLADLQDKLNKFDGGLIDEICESIDCLVFPKSLERANTDKLISNVPQVKLKVKDFQYMLDMAVEGYVLGIAWVLLIGEEFDGLVYEHSYGNRLRKTKRSVNSPQSPYLFQPYYTQYESWRDNGLRKAKEALAGGSDVIIMTMDIKRFFYGVDLDGAHLLSVVDNMTKKFRYSNSRETIKFLTEFIIRVIETYSDKLRTYDGGLIGERNVLPIGFHPSNVLSNFCLKKFDEAISDGWIPLYYGRYVDDIIIVETVSGSSEIREAVKKNELTAEAVIKRYLTESYVWKKTFKGSDKGLLRRSKKGGQVYYSVNKDFNEFKNSQFELQNDKVHVFYFDAKHTDALITCFQKNLTNNVSEFRYMPEDELVFSADDYSEIYKLTEDSTPNKISGISDFYLDSYKLSKFLGKYMRISSLIDDEAEAKFEKDIEKIFTDSAIITHYTAWEKIISIFVYNNKFDSAEKFIKNVCMAIRHLKMHNKDDDNYEKMGACFAAFLYSCLNKCYAVVWGGNANKSVSNIKDLIRIINLTVSDYRFSGNVLCEDYVLSRMCDKSSLPLLADGFIKNGELNLDGDEELNLTHFSENLLKKYNHNCLDYTEYKYYPYLITMTDLSVYRLIADIKGATDKYVNDDPKNLNALYENVNFGGNVGGSEYFIRHRAGDVRSKLFNVKANPGPSRAISVGRGKCGKVKIAVGNIKLCEDDFNHALEHRPNRSKERYFALVKMVNEAIHVHADMLVLPESYLPFEWLPTLARTCAKNQLAVITGVEHFTIDENCGNFTAVILPYTEEEYKFCYTFFHAKVHMAPHEIKVIRSHGYRPLTGGEYELYCWNDFWFPVYCCYELTSITDRAIFQSYADAVIAIEWNKDVNYYSNIVESLSRDIHCYLVQVNTSDYGDSRVTQPTQSVRKDILKVKGGINPAILVDELDISGLRDFQIKGNELQQEDKKFKPTPPGFDSNTVQNKIDGTLWDALK